eukprot:CCRYP_004796-RB/>CCRYP_004796-RB protein AED:0.09 eAED:0.09 QI:737/1/1/1/1/0.85/7/1245/731
MNSSDIKSSSSSSVKSTHQRIEICTLSKSKSGISSISFSSTDDTEEKKGEAFYFSPVQGDMLRAFSPSSRKGNVTSSPDIYALPERARLLPSKPIACPTHSDKTVSTDNLVHASSVSPSCPSKRPSFERELVVKLSKAVQGRLVARILPMQYADYDTHKSMARIDPSPLIRAYALQREDEADSPNNGSSWQDSTDNIVELQKVESPPSPNDAKSVVALDLYLFRSEFVEDPKNHSHCSEQTCNCQYARERLIHTLMNSIDLSRNNSSRVGFQKTETRSTTMRDNIFHLHMNRSAGEAAMRTLRRLEVSTHRKLKEMHPGLRKNKEQNLISAKSGASNCKLISVGNMEASERHNGSIDGFIDEDDGINSNTGYQCFDAIDICGISNADMWNECATESCKGYHREIALALPCEIMPWKRDDIIENHDIHSSSSDSLSSLSFASLEWIQFGIIANPPTLLSVQTFENFTAHVFTGVPIVLRTTVLYATHAVICWFVDQEIVLQDSNVYTPTIRDIGKRISVLVTPIRPGNQGDGFQEAYSFTALVEPLPTMPIVQIREKWIRKKCGDFIAAGKDDDKNRLRVLTFNILADLYAGRDIDQQYMYSHCDVRHLLRSRRMPMIVAEILSYKADIICLQEVDASIHDALLCPVLGAMGYQGFYSNKVTLQQEGCSMFWSTATFNYASDTDMMAFPLRTLLTKENIPSHSCNASPIQTVQYYDAKSSLRDLDIERWESM